MKFLQVDPIEISGRERKIHDQQFELRVLEAASSCTQHEHVFSVVGLKSKACSRDHLLSIAKHQFSSSGALLKSSFLVASPNREADKVGILFVVCYLDPPTTL